jgi:penicillin-insensitive murein endopeptidase
MRRMSRACVVLACSLAASAALGQEDPVAPVVVAAPEATATPEPSATPTVHTPRTSRHRTTKAAAPHHRRRRASHRARPTTPTRQGRDFTADGTSVSVGRHNRGRLVHGTELHESPVLRLKQPGSMQRFGTDELVALLGRAATRVNERTPGSRLTVGDLSMERGGRFRPHRSHQSGRDVDVGFYVVDALGALLELRRFFVFRRDGTSRADATFHYDFVRNWQLVEALVTDTEAPVQWIFVARELQVGLLAEGLRQAASEDTILRASTIMSQPRRGGAHRDHFHVRIYCPANDRPRCDDDPPFHPWLDRGTGAAPVVTTTTTPEPDGD